MHNCSFLSLCLLAGSSAAPALASPLDPSPAEPAPPPEPLPRVVVTGQNDTGHDWRSLDTVVEKPTVAAQARALDTGDLFSGTPGVAIVRNGPQTSLPQIRGLFGDRVKVLVDGMTVTPACPNHMDPPLHYLAPTRAASLIVMAGVTPVSLGGDSIAGTILADSPRPKFGTNQVFRPYGELTLTGSSLNNAFSGSGELGMSNRDWSLNYAGAGQTAGDYRFPGGKVRDTGYNVMTQNIRAAADTLKGQIIAEGGLSGTRNTGTPALPMDMIKDDGWYGRVRYDGDLSLATVTGDLYYHSTDHLMDNYSLRPAGERRMFSPAESQDFGFRLASALPRDQQVYRIGLDVHGNWFDAYQQNAVTAAQQTTINDGQRDRFGAFFEWQNDWSPQWRTLAGLRVDAIWCDAGPVVDYFPPSTADALYFNANRESFTNMEVDFTLASRFTANDWSAYEVGVARKNRVPSLLERYLWTPLSASAGMADGHNYMGNLGLDPETAYQFGVTGDWHGERWQVKVTPFYSLVYEYIQGMPYGRFDTATRLPVLQFQNLSRADLYGVDGSAQWNFVTDFTLSGTLSYVRGINRQEDDYLYRIAPLQGRVRLNWSRGAFSAGSEVVLVAAQNEVASYNGELPTPGYVVWNLSAGWQATRWMSLQAGVENLLNDYYVDHLAGINRVADSDVGLNQPLPGYGRFGYIGLRLVWN